VKRSMRLVIARVIILVESCDELVKLVKYEGKLSSPRRLADVPWLRSACSFEGDLRERWVGFILGVQNFLKLFTSY
jgi:hypothetical protein